MTLYIILDNEFFFEDGVSFEELKSLYEKIKQYGALVNNLPMTIDKYASIKADEKEANSDSRGR